MLSREGWQLRQAASLGGTLAGMVRQPYKACCLTEHRFRGVQWGDVNNMKMGDESTSVVLSFAYPNIYAGS